MILTTEINNYLAADYDHSVLMIKQSMLKIARQYHGGINYSNPPEFDSILSDFILWVASEPTALTYNGYELDVAESVEKYVRKTMFRFLVDYRIDGVKGWWLNPLIVSRVGDKAPRYLDALNRRGGGIGYEPVNFDSIPTPDYIDVSLIIDLVFERFNGEQRKRMLAILNAELHHSKDAKRWTFAPNQLSKIANQHDVQAYVVSRDLAELRALLATNSDAIQYA